MQLVFKDRIYIYIYIYIFNKYSVSMCPQEQSYMSLGWYPTEKSYKADLCTLVTPKWFTLIP